mmetsp:Transcript_10855/g.36891  ORF Transcript_10855/g.36891 Transcript_10855/m.36891 type:complete len:296 (-) Transcript_10855:579-1466(-)
MAVTTGAPARSASRTCAASVRCAGQATRTASPALMAACAAAAGPPPPFPRDARTSGSSWRRKRSTPRASQSWPRGRASPGGSRAPHASPRGSSSSRGRAPGTSASTATASAPGRRRKRRLRDASSVAMPPWPKVSGPRRRRQRGVTAPPASTCQGAASSPRGAATARSAHPSRTDTAPAGGSVRPRPAEPRARSRAGKGEVPPPVSSGSDGSLPTAASQPWPASKTDMSAPSRRAGTRPAWARDAATIGSEAQGGGRPSLSAGGGAPSSPCGGGGGASAPWRQSSSQTLSTLAVT